MKENKFCQSCGMPFTQDPNGGGTEKDQSKSTEYCSFCYVHGEFSKDFKNAKEMQDFCVKILKEQGMKGWKAWLYTRGIPRLNRWRV